MKFLRFICNLLLFTVVFFGSSVVQIIAYDIYAVQSEDVDGINVISTSEESVSVLDSVGFWATDIGTSIKTDAKYRVRNWVDADWWKISMSAADKGIDIVGAVVKPIILPISEINAVKNYYGLTLDNFTAHLAKYNYETDQELNNALYELYVIFDNGYGETVMTVGENPVDIHDWDGYDGRYLNGDIEIDKSEYGRWVNRNKKLYNHVWKLEKYNNPAYAKFYTKFIIADKTGENRHIKSAAVVLYYQFLVSITFATFFIIKYPITLLQYNITGKGKKKGNRRRHEEPITDFDEL